jgi:hypothetical protein
MSRRVLLALAVAVGVLGVGAAAVFLLAGDGEEPEPPLRAAHLERCDSIDPSEARICFTREFLAMVEDSEDPRPAIEAITRSSRRQGGFLLTNCHVVIRSRARDGRRPRHRPEPAA